MTWQLIQADCIEAMQGMDESSVDAIVTDPPYGLEFMGKEWDRLGDVRQIGDDTFQDVPTYAAKIRHGYGVDWRAMQTWHQAWATEALRVLKPGGHLLAFGGTRTYHRLACGLEDAGFEIRDSLAWLYGSGFPKSLDVSKAIDKAAGVEREVVGKYASPEGTSGESPGSAWFNEGRLSNITAPATSEAERWQGWGTALKPAFEPIVLARKPLTGTVAANVLEHGTGALNIDGTRIEMNGEDTLRPDNAQPFSKDGIRDDNGRAALNRSASGSTVGRWPANVLLDEQAAGMLDEQSGERVGFSGGGATPGDTGNKVYGQGWRRNPDPAFYADHGGASRFFYVPKADRAERNRGVGTTPQKRDASRDLDQPSSHQKNGGLGNPYNRGVRPVANNHPTVKPVELMQWLCRLITPPDGIVLDPFTGSGTTGIAALREGFSFVGIEREAEYVEIARDRIIGDAPLFNVQGEVTA